jgi:hypothetical protein
MIEAKERLRRNGYKEIRPAVRAFRDWGARGMAGLSFSRFGNDTAGVKRGGVWSTVGLVGEIPKRSETGISIFVLVRI